jgi:hypothetical protein
MSEERFKATSGRLTGVCALVIAAVVLILPVVDRGLDTPAWLLWLAATGAVLAWAAMLKPAIAVHGDDLVLRNMLETVRIPLAAVEQIAVRQVTAVRAGEKRYVSPAIGKSWRQALKTGKARDQGAAPTTYAETFEDRVWQLANDARARLGIANTSDEQLELARTVRREPAWLEIGALAVTLVGFVVTLVV